MPYSSKDFEKALAQLWELVEDRLTPEDLVKLGIDIDNETNISGIFEELWSCGPRGIVGLGLGRVGGHAIGD